MFSETYLFLDDVRQPIHAYTYTKQPIYKERTWIVVRNYNEFVDYIKKNGLPTFISFDHDLADEHYKSFTYSIDNKCEEKTGYDCAEWLVDYCINNNLKCPVYLCHSMNPVGKKRILDLLNNFADY